MYLALARTQVYDHLVGIFLIKPLEMLICTIADINLRAGIRALVADAQRGV